MSPEPDHAQTRARDAGSAAVAIVGMACRLPGGNTSPEDYWTFLLNKGCGIREVPSDRWNIEAYYNPNPDGIGTSVSKWGGFLDDIRGFDAGFFGISPREADAMDPQQRLLLQCSYEALQDSGHPLSDFQSGKTGVFVGISQSDYRTIQEIRLTNPEAFAGTGYALCIAANRVSHRLNLSGPSFAVDTACSSSMVALNEAVQTLAAGGCDTAIVAGVNVLAHPSSFIAFSRAGMLSKTGVVSTFDKAANGFVRGEGVGVVVLKPLGAALAAGDRVHAVIRATASNQDGRTATITAPSQNAQMAMLRDLIDRAGVPRDHIGFVEAHGTGTPVGDPIEAGAIGQVIAQHNPHGPVLIGSGKANVGHGEPAAGITGLIKAALAVRHGIVPPNANFNDPNPNIPFDALNLKVPTRAVEMPSVDGTRYAVVNSFGFGGTNASVLISSPPDTVAEPGAVRPADMAEDDAPAQTGFPLFFPLSGTGKEGLAAAARALAEALSPGGDLHAAPLSAVSAALALDRDHLAHRAVVLARGRDELTDALNTLANGDEDALGKAENIVLGQAGTDPSICFMFSGQGSQWWRMGRDLLLHDPTFAAAVDAYDAAFVKASGWSIKAELLRDEADSRIDDTTVTQPALFAIQAGLAALWARFGVRPDMVVGHSIGEAAASHVAGGLSLSGAARFLSKRGAIRDQLGQRGAMAAVGLQPEDVEAILPGDGKIGIAAVNGPGSTTISGDYDAIHAFVEEFQFTQPDTFIRLLKVDTAWHSYQLDAGEAWFRNEVAQIDWSVPRIPFISTVTGKPETRFDTDYGWLNLRCPVLFKAGIACAVKMGATVFVELGPHSTLAGPATSTALEAGTRATVLSSLSRKAPDFDWFACTAARLFTAGVELDWTAITGGHDRAITLPRAQWITTPHWQQSEEAQEVLYSWHWHPFLGRRGRGQAPIWRSELNTKAYPFLKDHRLQSDVVFPGAGYIDSTIAVGRALHGDAPLEIENARILDAMFLPDGTDFLTETVYSPERRGLSLYTRERDGTADWTLRCDARLRATDVPAPTAPAFDMESAQEIDVAHVYDVDSASPFVNYGPAFQVVDKLWMGGGMVRARITMPEMLAHEFDRFFAHPALLDGCLQIADPRMTPDKIAEGRKPGDPIVLPVGVRRIRVYGTLPRQVYAQASHGVNPRTGEKEAHFVITDPEGRVLMTAEGLMMREMPTQPEPAKGDEIAPGFARQEIVALRDTPDLPEGAPGRWLLIADSTERTGALDTAMSALGASVETVIRADLGDRLSDGLIDRFGAAFEAGEIAGLVYTTADAALGGEDDLEPEAVLAPIEAGVADLVALGDLMDFYRMAPHHARIVVLTSGAYPDADGHLSQTGLAQAPLAALARVLATETPEYSVRVVDIADPKTGADRAAQCILADTSESELILGDETVCAPRLRALAETDFDSRLLSVTEADRINFHATMRTPGLIDDLGLHEIPLETLGPDQVRIRVKAVGLNFRDIMAVTGLLPEEAEPDPAWQHLGLEFGAVVDEVGANVTGFKPGDRVMGMHRRCLQRFMVLDPVALTHVPDRITLEEAATIPTAFATAHYALNRVGRMQKGEKVFIHVATGGVGTAAVQLAQAADAEIFATAGSPGKRQILIERGVPHVMDSRSLAFADDVARITNGRGVDVLLNSLPGDYIGKGLDILAPYGRFLEIGKRDVYADSSIGMKALRKNVSLSVLDLAAMGQERPDLLADLMGEVVEKFRAGALSPLPLTAFPVSKITDAFRYMSQAKHVGKVVVTLDEPSLAVRRDPSRPARLRGDASYLVTGGTRGFGLTIADWMSRAGAGELLLVSRTGTVAEEDADRVAAMEARGTIVTPLSLDITDPDTVMRFVAERCKDDRPLRGVVHGAAVIKDGFTTQMTPEMIADVLRPKIAGGWALHRAFAAAGVQPDFLIGFSSIAQVIGSAGQSNYVAANAFLDALALYRRSNGLPGTAIDWGAMAESGFVARSEGLTNYLESVGLFGLSDEQTDNGMEVALTRDAPGFVYARADWSQIARANTALAGTARFAPMLQRDTSGAGDVRRQLMALSGDALREAAKDFVKGEISALLKVDPDMIQTDRPMSELGLDSLSSFELKMRVETALDFTLPVSKFLQAPSVDELANLLHEEVVQLVAAEAAGGTAKDNENGTGDAGGKTRLGHRASNGQMGLYHLATAPFTSASVRAGLEHRRDIPLPDGMERDRITKAAETLADRHPVLRMVLTDAATGAVTYDGPGLQIEAGDGTAPLGVADGVFGRLWLDEGDGTASRLHLHLHGIMADTASADLLATELTALLAGETLPDTADPALVPDLMTALHFDPEAPMGQADRSFWHYALNRPMDPVPFDRRGRALLPHALGADHGPARVLTGRMAATEAADRLMVFARALRVVTGSEGPVLMSRSVDLRADPGNHALVGPLAVTQPLLVPSQPDDTATVAQFRRVLAAAGAHRSFDSHSAAQSFSDRFGPRGTTPFQIAVRNVGTEEQDRPVTAAMHDAALEIGPDGRFRLILDADVVPEDTAEALAAALAAG